MPNYDEQDQVAFGFFNGNLDPELLDEIMQEGTDLDYVEMVEDLKGFLARFHLLDGHNEAIHEAVESVEDVIGRHDLYNNECDRYLYEKQAVEGDEDGYYKLSLSYLGGAPLVCVEKSDWAVEGTPGSPCIPGGVNIDEENLNDGSQWAYCLPPSLMPSLLLPGGSVVVRNLRTGSTCLVTRADPEDIISEDGLAFPS